MMRLVFFLTLVVASVYSINYDPEQIKELLVLNAKCLNSFGVLNDNATFSATLAYGYSFLAPTAPNARPDLLEAAEAFREYLNPVLEATFIKNPNHILAPYHPLDYLNTRADIKFDATLPFIRPPYEGTFETIAEETMITSRSVECFTEVWTLNQRSLELRECILSCEEEMSLEEYTGEHSPFIKSYYVGFTMGTNCSNYDNAEYRRRAAIQCTYIKPILDYMLQHKTSQAFQDTLHYYLVQCAYCANWGLLEFVTKEIIAVIIDNMDCNGCVGFDKYPPDVAQILTADTSMMLANLLRMTAETTSKRRRFG